MATIAPPSFQKYDTGILPKIAISGSTVVEVHQSQNLQDIYYHVGQLDDTTWNYGPSTQYDDGITPGVALNASGTVVEVHQSNGGSSNLWCHVGPVNTSSKSISFGKSQQYDKGTTPSVALNDHGVVVEIHQSNGASTSLWYNVGQVDTSKKEIDFGKSWEHVNGVTPIVALNNNGLVVEVHQSNGPSFNLWYTVGQVNTSDKSISFGESQPYDTGTRPAITLTDDGRVIEVHRSQTFDTLWRRTGTVNAATNTIVWDNNGISILYGQGDTPSIGLSGANLIQVDQSASFALMYAATTLADHSNWMADNLSLLGSRQLQQIVLPASHDAGMYTLESCFPGANSCNTQTQTRTIGEQLVGGSRYFDLRPVLYNSTLYTGHYFALNAGCNGGALSDILSQVKEFMQNSRDLVILKFSHYFNRDSMLAGFGTAQMEQLINLVTSTLGPVLYTGAVPSGGLATATLNDLMASGGRVLAVFDELDSSLKESGIYSYLDRSNSALGGKTGTADLIVYDVYAQKSELDEMISNQLEKLDNPANHGGSLFLLSWTLTLSAAQSVVCGSYSSYVTSILSLADQAAEALYPTMQQWLQGGQISTTYIPNLLYIDNSRGYATEVALWLNQQLLA
ncbi:hypothetical protein Q5H93_23335 [Hymenobacter sp. ASUV-10]|uniref:Phosphatidylinositol diacylglycerol-lyase n=1 Tax=Hymenobacter aranciens TaxID=3063996 RepID=A0ABT9BJ43_9BACT|nr:hypothetical protein [Hymenobacter sp. ASUV-10]MDO7877689.1 hypothetical protein [Hymenobacter sp. ASUV-10]